MVDLGFLLLTFFVFTTKLSEPKVMNIHDTHDGAPSPVCESCTLTVILEKDGRIGYYAGAAAGNSTLGQTSFSPMGIRRILEAKQEAVARSRGQAAEMVLIIKPADNSVLSNFVDIMDEVAITGIKRYYLDELDDRDKALLANQAF